jgi:hypothetical protein
MEYLIEACEVQQVFVPLKSESVYAETKILEQNLPIEHRRLYPKDLQMDLIQLELNKQRQDFNVSKCSMNNEVKHERYYKEPIVRETVRRKIIEEVQPVIDCFNSRLLQGKFIPPLF